MEMKSQKLYLTYYNSMIAAQDLCQDHNQILLIIFLKEFTELNVNANMMIKNLKLVELDISIVTVFFEFTNFKYDLTEYKCFCCNKSYQHNFDEKLKRRLFNTYKF